MRISLVVLVAGAACSGATSDGDPTEPAVLPPPPPDPVARELRVNAFVAWDAELGEVVDPTIDGEPSRSLLVLTLSGPPVLELEDCTVTVELASLVGAAPEIDGWWELDVPSDLPASAVATDCAEKGYDFAQYVDEDALAYWGGLAWTLRILGDDLQPELVDGLPAVVDPSFVVQGALDGEEPYGLVDEPLGALAYWRAYELVDGDVAAIDGPLSEPVPAVDLVPDDKQGLPSGYYVYDDLVVVPLPEALTR